MIKIHEQAQIVQQRRIDANLCGVAKAVRRRFGGIGFAHRTRKWIHGGDYAEEADAQRRVRELRRRPAVKKVRVGSEKRGERYVWTVRYWDGATALVCG